ncbi:hypothetical protein EDD22DRAFT_961868 [Suillus occidentalis]|nr:hypothetical protein EDD22DRAFT_961868 [Suillus occidentalis]
MDPELVMLMYEYAGHQPTTKEYTWDALKSAILEWGPNVVAATPDGLKRIAPYALVGNVPLALHVICQLLETARSSKNLEEPSIYAHWVPTLEESKEDPPTTKWKMMNTGDAIKYAMDVIRHQGEYLQQGDKETIMQVFMPLYLTEEVQMNWTEKYRAATLRWSGSDLRMTPVPLWESGDKEGLFGTLKLQSARKKQARWVHRTVMKDAPRVDRVDVPRSHPPYDR